MKTTQLMTFLALAAATVARGENSVPAAPSKAEAEIIVSGVPAAGKAGTSTSSSSSSSFSTTSEDGVSYSSSSTIDGDGHGRITVTGPEGKKVIVFDGEAGDVSQPMRWTFRSDDGDTLVSRKTAGPVTYLGISTAPVTEELAPHLSIPPDTGLVVEVVASGSPAEQAGLQRNDIIARLDDQILIQPRQLSVLVANHKEGDKVKLVLVRQGKETDVTATLGKKEASVPAVELGRAVRGIAGEPAPLRTFTRRLELHPGENGVPTLRELPNLAEEIRKAAQAARDENGAAKQAVKENEAVEKQLAELRAQLEQLSRTLQENSEKK